MNVHKRLLGNSLFFLLQFCKRSVLCDYKCTWEVQQRKFYWVPSSKVLLRVVERVVLAMPPEQFSDRAKLWEALDSSEGIQELGNDLPFLRFERVCEKPAFQLRSLKVYEFGFSCQSDTPVIFWLFSLGTTG